MRFLEYRAPLSVAKHCTIFRDALHEFRVQRGVSGVPRGQNQAQRAALADAERYQLKNGGELTPHDPATPQPAACFREPTEPLSAGQHHSRTTVLRRSQPHPGPAAG
jgi:hypothetical protein